MLCHVNATTSACASVNASLFPLGAKFAHRQHTRTCADKLNFQQITDVSPSKSHSSARCSACVEYYNLQRQADMSSHTHAFAKRTQGYYDSACVRVCCVCACVHDLQNFCKTCCARTRNPICCFIPIPSTRAHTVAVLASDKAASVERRGQSFVARAF